MNSTVNPRPGPGCSKHTLTLATHGMLEDLYSLFVTARARADRLTFSSSALIHQPQFGGCRLPQMVERLLEAENLRPRQRAFFAMCP
jgi:hypothetical protein